MRAEVQRHEVQDWEETGEGVDSRNVEHVIECRTLGTRSVGGSPVGVGWGRVDPITAHLPPFSPAHLLHVQSCSCINGQCLCLKVKDIVRLQERV